MQYPVLTSSNAPLQRAYRIAMGDLAGNVQPFRDGLLDQPQPVLLAGLDYDTPWTRDAAINVWNGLGLIWPEVAYNTLLSVLERHKGQIRIGGQYWDAIIWAQGAWAYFLQTGDREFLALAFTAVVNSLARFEAEEFDSAYGLFRGPAVYGDGVAAYPDRYSPGGTSSILDWVLAHPQEKAAAGYGIPMMVLSTNCVYVQAYRIAGWMAEALGLPPDAAWQVRAGQLIDAIQAHLWNPARRQFDFLIDAQGRCDHQEGLGTVLTLLFGIATAQQVDRVLETQHITPAGIPCVWPTFERYARLGGYGRHSGTVWPFISGIWGEAALQHGRFDLFEREFGLLTEHINRDAQCAEIYHPLTGEIYGGLQENGKGADGMQWASCARQSWTASTYLRMVLHGLLGLDLTPHGLTLRPALPASIGELRLEGLRYGNSILTIHVRGHDRRVAQCRVNNEIGEAFLPAAISGIQEVVVDVKD